MVYTYFTAMINSQGVPLAYIICKTPYPSSIFIDREHYIIKNDTPKGNMFFCETKKFLDIIKDPTVDTDTDTDTQMKGKHRGRELMLVLQKHYNGKS